MGTNYETPLAGDYLELRAELSHALFALIQLATEARSPAVCTRCKPCRVG